ncbi:plasmid replication protein, CyRepA1 family, partial [Chroococcus sp. FPU101]|uniref:plasmid replication protein, CyRepA1 family n=1 Tax=Chroococcus sp. FPU101 TaxID=1974212 RepID=UPI001A90C7EC
MLKHSHYQELEKSAIAPEIIELNFKSIEGNIAYESLLYGLSNDERRNDGRLRDYWLRRYQHLDHGGWWCGTINPITNKESLWGCFKPDKPKTDREKGKPIKYEHPPKVSTEVFFPKVTWGIGLKIAIKCGLEDSYKERMAAVIGIATTETFYLTEDIEFWQWVIENPVPITIGEGVKKAASLLSAGYCAVGLPGIWSGIRKPKDDFGNAIGLSYLIPQLEPFATQRREINFCFDNDSKPKTRQAVRQATLKTGNLFKFKGCKVSVTLWDGSEKGVDDLIAAKGTEYFDEVYNSRTSLELFNLKGFKTLYPDLTVNQRYLNVAIPKDAQVIWLKSAKKTGKTELMARIVSEAIAKGQRCFVIGHRVKLLEDLGNRFGLPYRLELRTSEQGATLGYCLCIDSLHPNANPSFNPSDSSEALVIIDEFEQGLWHLLNSPTCRANRVSIIETFQTLLRTVVATGGKIYLADADLSRISIDYVERAIGFPVKTWGVENTFKSSQGRKLFVYDDSESLYSALLTHIRDGGKPIIFTGAKDAKSKLATGNLERGISIQFPQSRILVLDSDTCKDPSHPAYKAMGNLNQVLNDYDVVIASPVLETGISIDIKNHFTSVFGFGTGKQTVNGFCQGLDRLRDDVPRHIWVAKYSSERVGNGETDLNRLLRSEHQKFKVTFNSLALADTVNSLDGSNPETLQTWGKMACFQNLEAKNYRECILNKLQSEGYELIENLTPSDPYVSKDESKLLLTLIKEDNYERECEANSSAANPTDEEFKKLEQQNDKTPQQRYTHRKGK